MDNQVTIHDTQDDVEGFEEIQESVDDRELGIVTSKTIGGEEKEAPLGATNPLD